MTTDGVSEGIPIGAAGRAVDKTVTSSARVGITRIASLVCEGVIIVSLTDVGSGMNPGCAMGAASPVVSEETSFIDSFVACGVGALVGITRIACCEKEDKGTGGISVSFLGTKPGGDVIVEDDVMVSSPPSTSRRGRFGEDTALASGD
jgi:hypothetical protein